MDTSKLKKVFLETYGDLNLESERFELFPRSYFLNHKRRYLSDLKFLSKYFSGGKILEVGCFPFQFTLILKKLGYDVTGIDLNPSLARQIIDGSLPKLVGCDIERERFPFKDDSFDFIIFNEVLEHLGHNPVHALEEIKRVLKPGGKMLLTTPNLYYLENILSFNLGKGFNDPIYHFNRLSVVGFVGHVREYSRKEVEMFLDKTDFKVLELKHKMYIKTGGRFAFVKNFFMGLVPGWRPYQAFICQKV